MQHKYGEFTQNQISETKKYIRKQIFFLLLIVDPKTSDQYENIDVENAISGLQYRLAGLNELIFCPPELVSVMSLLEAALLEYRKEDWSFDVYRKLVLDAGSEVLKIEEV